MNNDYLDYDLSDFEDDSYDGEFDALSLSESASEDSEEISLASVGFDGNVDDLITLKIKPTKSVFIGNKTVDEEPHSEILMEVKYKLSYIISQEKDVYMSKELFGGGIERSYGSRRPKNNEIIIHLHKLLHFVDRIVKNRDSKSSDSAFFFSTYFQSLDKDVISLLQGTWKEREITVQPYKVLNVENTALKDVLKFYKQVQNRVKEYFGPKIWPAKMKIISSLSKTSSSSSVNASEVLPSEFPSVGSTTGVFTALNQKTFSSANRSPQFSRTSFDSPQITNASTVREIASSSEERPNRGSPVNSPRAHNTHIISSSGVKPNPSASSDE